MTCILIFLSSFFGIIQPSPTASGLDFDVVKTDTMRVPILDYSELKPILNRSGDTTYVVNFWATWCGPCVKELPYFEALHEEFADEKVKVILVSLDFKKQIESKLIPFMKKKKLKSEVVVLYDHDSNFWINDISSNWSGSLPGTLIYKNDEREFFERTFHSQSELNDIIKPYLNL